MPVDVPVIIEPMRLPDIPAVMRIERAVFPSPWSETGYRRELTQNSNSRYFVLRVQEAETDASRQFAWLPEGVRKWFQDDDRLRGPVIGYAGYWLRSREAHVMTIAVDVTWRRRGLGEWLFLHTLADAIARGAETASLEVRPSNTAARALYESYDFDAVKRRKQYYADGEDALLMARSGLQSQAFQQFLATRRAALTERLSHRRQPERDQETD